MSFPAGLVSVAVTAVTLTGLGAAAPSGAATPRKAKIARISRAVFGTRWRVAACIAHFESTDGAWLYNGSSLGPWQINTAAHPWVNGRRLVTDWTYSARVAYRISDAGRHWQPWSTARLCGAPL